MIEQQNACSSDSLAKEILAISLYSYFLQNKEETTILCVELLYYLKKH